MAVENTTDADGDGEGVAETTRTEYLTDGSNHTGYSQVLKETTFAVNADGSNGEVTKEIVYAIGHDQISQTVTEDGSSTTHYFGADGHGSVRALYEFAGSVVKIVLDAET